MDSVQRFTVAGHRGAEPPSVDVAAQGSPRVGTGNALLDHFLHGGIPRGSVCLVLGAPYAGADLIAASFALAAARAKEPLVVCLTGMSPARFRALVHRLGPGLSEHEAAGSVAYVDCHAATLGGASVDPLAVASPAPDEPRSVLRAIQEARARLGDPPDLRVVVLGLTDLALRFADFPREGYPWMQTLLGHCRAWGATCVLTAEQGAHADAELTLFRHLSDGTIELREREDARTYLRMRGLGGAITKDWVEYEAGPTGLQVIGSFTENKIR